MISSVSRIATAAVVDILAAIDVSRQSCLSAEGAEVGVANRQVDRPAGDPVTPCPAADHLGELQQVAQDLLPTGDVPLEGSWSGRPT